MDQQLIEQALSKPNPNLHFAIIGDGPVALALLSYLVYCKNKHNIEITIFLGGRSSYTRNHVISISQEITQILETLVSNPRCFNPSKLPRMSMQIKCLETILFESIDKKNVTIKPQWTPETEMAIYDYIFCADGAQSTSRNAFFGSYAPLSVRFNNQILTLYWDFPENCSDLEKMPKKHVYEIEDLKEIWGDEDYYNINALISLVYNMNQRTLDFITPPVPTSINLWISGFNNFVDFDKCFSNIIEYINAHDIKEEFRLIAENRKIYYSDVMKSFIETPEGKHKLAEVYRKYKSFVKQELEKNMNMDKSFLFHFIRPAANSFGIHFDNQKLTYCLEQPNEFRPQPQKIWLIGDSCNSFPPGHSLEIGLRDVIHLINIIFNNLFKTSFVPVGNFVNINQYMHCLQGVLTLDNCEKLNRYSYMGGYLNGNTNNYTLLKFTDLIQKIISNYATICSPPTSDIDEYNKYQIFNFFNNLINIMCNVEFNLNGGKPRNIKKYKKIQKNTKKYKKYKKYKTYKKNTKKYKTKKYFF